jgi:hypothetical protein
MAMIHINRAGTSLGTFSEEDVREGLRTGRFVPTDLGWREGMSTWLSLSQFPEFGAEVAGAAPPSPTTTPVVAQVSGAEIPASRSGLPWEHRQERGFWNAFIETLVIVLGKPQVAFATMKTEGGLVEPLIYAVIGGSFGWIVYFLFTFLLQSFGIFADKSNALAGLIGMGIGSVFFIILAPLFVALCVLIGAGLIHLSLMIVGGAKKSFETTFRVICFSFGSVQPLVIVPFCGGLVAGVWGIVLYCLGLARTHQTDTGRAVLAVFLPMIVCCGGGLLLTIMFGTLGALGQ